MSNIDNLAIASDSIMASAFANATKAKTKPTTSKHKPKTKGPRGFTKNVKMSDVSSVNNESSRGFTKARLVSDSYPCDAQQTSEGIRVYNPNYVFETNCKYTLAPNQKQLLVTIGHETNIGEYKSLYIESVTVKLMDGTTTCLKLPLQPFVIKRDGEYGSKLTIKRRISESDSIEILLYVTARPDGSLALSGDIDCVESFMLIIDDGTIGKPATVKDDFDTAMCHICKLAKSVALPNLTRPVVWSPLTAPHHHVFGKVATSKNDISVIKKIVELWDPKFLCDINTEHFGRYTTTEGDSITVIKSIVTCSRNQSVLYHFTVNSTYRVSMFLKI